ncbi:cytochrome c oxidase subunit II [Halobaculum marinum]|uniref:cytochrome-c oxidase n=1 Tax=Halobaculum marinum TaxID=3031996 RepID=A0ABD5WW03_9EURY|nr:cytochrome c oxidase subunit II [Halobaculum sp. DT55]
MRRHRGLAEVLAVVGLVVVGVAGVVALSASPAAAQSVNRDAIDNLNEQLLYVALPLVLFVEITLVYAVYRFRDNDDPTPTTKDSPLEITWTAATGVILLFVGVSAYFVLANPYITPAAASGPTVETDGDPVEVDVVAYQWGWEFRYPDANVTTDTRLVLPRGRDVVLSLHTRDVIHSFYVPDLGLKQDAVPGQTTPIRTRATETGEYRLYCAELCGVGHARMHGTVTVVSPSAYDEWLATGELPADESTTASENATAVRQAGIAF